MGFPKNIGLQLSLPIVIDQFGQSDLTHFHSFIPCVHAKMKARNRLASRNLVVELIRCTNDHSAKFTSAIRSRFSPPEFPNVWSAVSFCSHASVLHGFSFRCLQCGNRRAGLAGTIQEQIVDEEWRQPQQIEESYCFPAAIARRQHEWSRQFSLAERTEKAGVGGSTPSLATNISTFNKLPTMLNPIHRADIPANRSASIFIILSVR